MFVKICGVTNLEDALAAIDAGAAALGFNFYRPSTRFIEPETLAPWIGTLPASIWKVGVFVNEQPSRIAEIARTLALDIVQLHGDESPRDVPAGWRVWKAARVQAGFELAALDDYPAEAILIDGPASGRTFDWTLAAPRSHKVIIAGGLDDSNVRQAIECARPWGVDACSRIEAAPGRKDHSRMARFIKAALSC